MGNSVSDGRRLLQVCFVSLEFFIHQTEPVFNEKLQPVHNLRAGSNLLSCETFRNGRIDDRKLLQDPTCMCGTYVLIF